MDILVCGLNSYLGKACVSYMQDETCRIHGLVRDEVLFKKNMELPVRARISSVDLIRKGLDFDSFQAHDLKLAFYFTQIPDLDDKIAKNYELLSLRNFIHLSQKNSCNRIIYVGRLYDRSHLKEVEQLFRELNVVFTILLKDIAIGAGTTFDRFMNEMLKHKLVFLFKPHSSIKFNPVLLSDVFRWIKNIEWGTSFINQYVEFGGAKLIDFYDIFRKYAEKRKPDIKFKILPFTNRLLPQLCNKYFYGIKYDLYSDYILELSKSPPVDNSIWEKQFDFKYTSIDEGI
ncbi:Rossmann-fold NAD(P)-binding domain-containing protein [Sphingobacterium pedocola]|uniref:Uncharacterized protein n=1 Tax=Sphingobacterium pedocola TaxID=2082722 RepID=A0ABR9TDQ3_9SPHI|nr:hypothetical protein [Sphingobacterium pedocola]MBE8723177.1 hypothetical protein [Sphingobacterium pedocola]